MTERLQETGSSALPMLVVALEESAGDALGSLTTQAGTQLTLLGSVSAALRNGTLPLRDQEQARAVLDAACTIRAQAERRFDREAAVAAAACLSSAGMVLNEAVLAWYTERAADTQASEGARLALSGVTAAASPALLPAVHATLEALRPPTEAFCEAGGAAPDAAAAAAFRAACGPRLWLLAALLRLLPPASLFPQLLRGWQSDRGWPHGGVGVEDGGCAVGPRCALAASALSGAASLAPQAQPRDGPPAWGSCDAADAAEAVLLVLAGAFAGEVLREGDAAVAGQPMLAASLAARAPTLRLAMLPLSPHSCVSDAFGAALAAQSLRAALCRLHHPSATAALPAVLPCLLVALEQSAPGPRAHAQKAAHHLASACTRTSLRGCEALLVPALLAGLGGCESEGWPHCVGAGAALALALAGCDPAAPALHALLETLLGELALRPLDAERARPALLALPALARCAGLHLLRHTRRLLPILADWAQGEDAQLRELAAEALTAALERIWPRAQHHAPLLWPALLRGFALAGREPRTRAALLRLAEQLHYAGGDAFAQAWRAAQCEHEETRELFDALRALPLVAGQQSDAAGEQADEPPSEHALWARVAPDPYALGVEAEPGGDAAHLARLQGEDAAVRARLGEWAAGDTLALLRGPPALQEGPLDEVDAEAGEALIKDWLRDLALESTPEHEHVELLDDECVSYV